MGRGPCLHYPFSSTRVPFPLRLGVIPAADGCAIEVVNRSCATSKTWCRPFLFTGGFAPQSVRNHPIYGASRWPAWRPLVSLEVLPSAPGVYRFDNCASLTCPLQPQKMRDCCLPFPRTRSRGRSAVPTTTTIRCSSRQLRTAEMDARLHGHNS